MNAAVEDYLKLIYELEQEYPNEYIKNATLANHFGYTLQSVNEMIKRMESKRFLTYKPYKGVRLSEKGKKEALRMIRAHRLWEVFLSDKLGLSWESLHEEAEKLEHSTSDRILGMLYEYLKRPQYCKHGNPIPDEKGRLPTAYRQSLASMKAGVALEIRRVVDHKPLLHHLNTLGLGLGDTVEVLEKDGFSELITIRKDGQPLTLSYHVASMIYGVPREPF